MQDQEGQAPQALSSPVTRIEFLCAEEDAGVVAEPVAAGGALPAWFRRLPGVDGEELSATNNGLTVKRCLPFLDAMSAGWLLPLAATVRLEIADEGRTVTAGWELDSELVSPHASFQAAGNPYEPRPLLKFHNPWSIRTPDGWSCLIVPPLNRPSTVFEVLSGVVDTDRYVAPVNLPFVALAGDGVHTLQRGTPLAQVIPFHRDALGLQGVVRAETGDEQAERRRVHRSTLAGAGWYRRNARGARE